MEIFTDLTYAPVVNKETLLREKLEANVDFLYSLHEGFFELAKRLARELSTEPEDICVLLGVYGGAVLAQVADEENLIPSEIYDFKGMEHLPVPRSTEAIASKMLNKIFK